MLVLATLPEPVSNVLTSVQAALEQLAHHPSMAGYTDNFRGLAMSGDPIVLSILFVLSLCAAGVAWSLLMIVARGLFGSGRRHVRRAEVRPQPVVMATGSAVPAQARLDDGPDGALRSQAQDATLPAVIEKVVRPTFGAAVEQQSGSRLAAAVGGPQPATDTFGFGRVPALPKPAAAKALPFRQITLAEKPRLAELGNVVSARPELTGRVSPTSLKAAGAVEQCHISTRVDCAGGTAGAVREKDFRLFSLPRVDAEGRAQPDMMVFNVSDNGILPRSVVEWPGKRARRD